MEVTKKSKHKVTDPNLPGARWKKAKLIFFNATGVKKPKSKTFFGTINKPTEGMDKTLAKFDTPFVALNGDLKALGLLQKSKADFVTVKSNYLKTLKAAYDSPPGEVDAATYKAAVVMLEKELKSIESTITVEIANRMSFINGNKALEDQFVTLVHRIRKTIDSAQATIARVKVIKGMTVAEFNVEMNKAARDISAQLNNIALLQKKGYDVKLAPPQDVMTYLNTWHTGGSSSQLPEDASQKDMANALIMVDSNVEAIDRWAESVNV